MRRRTGKAIGVLAGATTAGLAAAFIWGNPTGHGPLTFQTFGIGVVTIPAIGILGIAAVIASFSGAAKTLLLLFVISFLPFGAWSLVANNIVHWFGIAQFGYVLSAYLQNPTWMRDP